MSILPFRIVLLPLHFSLSELLWIIFSSYVECFIIHFYFIMFTICCASCVQPFTFFLEQIPNLCRLSPGVAPLKSWHQACERCESSLRQSKYPAVRKTYFSVVFTSSSSSSSSLWTPGDFPPDHWPISLHLSLWSGAKTLTPK